MSCDRGPYIRKMEPVYRVRALPLAPTTVTTHQLPAGPGARSLHWRGLMAEGRSNAGIAESLVLTVGAVEKHVQSILSKLDLPQAPSDHRRVLAVLTYLQQADDATADSTR